METTTSTSLSLTSHSVTLYRLTDKMTEINTPVKAPLCTCRISFSNGIWSITTWDTDPKYRHLGYGKITLKQCLDDMLRSQPRPKEIRYNWDGKNQYVKDWLDSHFDPVEVTDTDSTAKIYKLNLDKVFDYFVLNKVSPIGKNIDP